MRRDHSLLFSTGPEVADKRPRIREREKERKGENEKVGEENGQEEEWLAPFCGRG